MELSVGTPRSGNTNAERAKISRSYFITNFNDELQHPTNTIYDISCDYF